MSKRASACAVGADDADGVDDDLKRPRVANGDVSWLWTVLFGPESDTWGRLPRVSDDDQATVLAIIKGAGLRAVNVANPRAGVAIYTHNDVAVDVAGLPPMEQSVWLMLGIHPNQAAFEAEFLRLRPRYLLLRLVQRLQGAASLRRHPSALALLCELEAMALDPSKGPQRSPEDAPAASCEAAWEAAGLGRVGPEMVACLGTVAAAALTKDASAVGFRNDALFNAFMDRFLDATGVQVHDVTCNAPADARFRRLNMSFYDKEADYARPPRFAFKPSLPLLLAPPPRPAPRTPDPAPYSAADADWRGFEGLVPDDWDPLRGDRGARRLLACFTSSFWQHLGAGGYEPPAELVSAVSGPLSAWVASGLVVAQGGVVPLSASFEPAAPFGLYIFGVAGAGKSSFVRHLVSALALAVNQLLDPQMEVRFVKHNLNKPLRELKHELQLRPNNNDLSVMSIIQGRRQTFSQAKRGLVVIALEEVPPEHMSAVKDLRATADTGADDSAAAGGQDGEGGDGDGAVDDPEEAMDQVPILSHLAERFKGIDGDATLIPVLTSNYPLAVGAREALSDLKMFKGVVSVEVSGVAGSGRRALATRLFLDLLRDQTSRNDAAMDAAILAAHTARGDSGAAAGAGASGGAEGRRAAAASGPSVEWLEPVVDLDLGAGDTRPLILKLRVAAFAAALAARAARESGGGGCARCARCAVRVRLAEASTGRDGSVVVALFLCCVCDAEGQGVEWAPPVTLHCGGGGGNWKVLVPFMAPLLEAAAAAARQSVTGARGVAEAVAGALGGLRDPRAKALQAAVSGAASAEGLPEGLAEGLGRVADYFFAGALAPAMVVVRSRPALAAALVDLLAGKAAQSASPSGPAESWCAAVRGVDPLVTKMTRSLYDASSTRNLRDLIIRASTGAASAATGGRVVVELLCGSSVEAQLLIREIVEDSPSMTSFSTAKSALLKAGLFFVVAVEGDLTPELASRASLVVE